MRSHQVRLFTQPGADEDCGKTQLLLGSPCLGNRCPNVLNRQHRRTVHALGGDGTEFDQPIVVRSGNRGRQAIVVVNLGVGEQAAGRKQHRHIDAFSLHGIELALRTPTPFVVVFEDLETSVLSTHVTNETVLVGVLVVKTRDELSVVLEIDIGKILVGADRRPAPIFGLDVVEPQVPRLLHMHVAVEDLVTTNCHGASPRLSGLRVGHPPASIVPVRADMFG